MKLFAITKVLEILPRFFKALTVDGKFSKVRAIILLVAMGLVAILYHFFGAAGGEVIIDGTEDVSDIIGQLE
jgi:hypothetical protein